MHASENGGDSMEGVRWVISRVAQYQLIRVFWSRSFQPNLQIKAARGLGGDNFVSSDSCRVSLWGILSQEYEF